jgi:hypothetical protein|tara:strand:- start:7766 stop:8284 length:519 start_codon:yes stop_codon:yes gene_type:complete
MGKSLTASLDLRVSWEHANTPDAGGPIIKDHNNITLTDSLADGTGVDSADLVWHDVRTLAGSTSEDLDFAGGVSDQFGATITFAKVRGLVIRNQTTTATHILEIGGASSNDWNAWLGATGDVVKVGPDGCLFIWNPSAAGFAVTAGTGDILKINNAGAGATTYQIAVIGSSV